MKHYRCRAALCCVGLLLLSCMDISTGLLVALALPLMAGIVRYDLAARRQEDAARLRRRYALEAQKKTARCGDTEAVNRK